MAGRRASKVYWNETCSPPSFPALAGDIKVDLAIVGGGMVGISAARFAKDRGMTVAVIEKPSAYFSSTTLPSSTTTSAEVRCAFI